MREIKIVSIVTAKPSGPGDYGKIEEGRFFVENNWVTLCDESGTPLRDDNTGQRVTMRLLPGEDEKAAAKKLTLQQYRAANRDEMAGFSRTIRYPDRGWA
jgi:hypothetical protein